MSSSVRFPDPRLRSSITTVRSDWIDYNGHLNMAYYNVLFDGAVDEAMVHVGLGPDYLAENEASFFSAEVHVCYLRELAAGDPVFSTFQLLDFDSKRMHYFQELYHAEQEYLSATSEQLALHVDMSERKVTPFPEPILAALQTMKTAHKPCGWPDRAGRSIGIVRK